MNIAKTIKSIAKSTGVGFLVLSAIINLPLLWLVTHNYMSKTPEKEIVSNFLAYDKGRDAHELDRQFRKRIDDRFKAGIDEKKLIHWMKSNGFSPVHYASRTGDVYRATRSIPRPNFIDECNSTASIEWTSNDEKVVTMIRGGARTDCTYL